MVNVQVNHIRIINYIYSVYIYTGIYIYRNNLGISNSGLKMIMQYNHILDEGNKMDKGLDNIYIKHTSILYYIIFVYLYINPKIFQTIILL